MALGMGTDFRFDIFARDRTGPAWRGVENSVQRAQRSVQSFMRAAGPLLGLSGAVSVGALAFATREALEYADALVQAADRTSFAVEELEALRYAGRLNRVQFQQTDMAVQRFSRRVAEAANGTGELEGDLSALGIRLRDSEGRMRSSYEILLDYADAVANAESEQEQLRLTFKAVDSEGAALVNVLRQGRSGLEGYAEQAREAGAIMGDELARNAAEAATAFERMRVNFEADRNRAVAEHAEGLERLAEALSDIVTLGFQAGAAIGNLYANLADGQTQQDIADGEALQLRFLRNQLEDARERVAIARAAIVDPDARTADQLFYGRRGLQAEEDIAELEGRIRVLEQRIERRAMRAGLLEMGALPDGEEDEVERSRPPRREPVDPSSSPTPRLNPLRAAEIAANEESAAKVEAARKAAEEIAGIQAEEYEQEMQRLAQQFEKEIEFGLQGAFRAAVDGDLLSFFARNLQNAVFESVAQGLASAFAEEFVGSSFGSFLSGILGGSFGGGRAAGGPVQPGKFYAWQEQGQEFFAPNVPGQVLRADKMGGGAVSVTSQLYVDARGATPDAVAELRSQLPQAFAANNEQLIRKFRAEVPGLVVRARKDGVL